MNYITNYNVVFFMQLTLWCLLETLTSLVQDEMGIILMDERKSISVPHKVCFLRVT